MSLGPGTTLAHYRITAALGAGGMGEVWRATDEKLGRDVALKVLPEEFARDPERMARFEREAKVLASLNHPNIAHLYGLESVNTQMAAGTAAPQGSQALRKRLWRTRPACKPRIQTPRRTLVQAPSHRPRAPPLKWQPGRLSHKGPRLM